jgi:hypothetical protein
MTVAFVNVLRTRGDAVRISEGKGESVHLRVEVPELWETIRVDAASSAPVLSVKVHALEALGITGTRHDGYVVKLNGFEVLDEKAPLRQVGIVDGSTLLITSRRRRPVR